MGRPDGVPTFLDGFPKAGIRLRMLKPPAAQKPQDVFGGGTRTRERYNPSKWLPGFDEDRRLAVRVHALDQVRKAPRSILNG